MKKTIYWLLSVIAVFALTLGCFMSANASSTAGALIPQTSNARMLIPLYIYPSGNAWVNVVDANLYNNIDVIVNPDNGVGVSKNTDFADGVTQLRAGNLGIYGYVYTSHGARSLTTVKAEIDNWQLWYGVDGIFLDEASNINSEVSYFTDLWNYITAKGMTVILNPGTGTIESYIAVANTNVIYESDPSNLLSLPSWAANYPASEFGVLQYAADVDQMRTLVADIKTKNIGYVFVTSDVLPNPWDTLPSYLAEEAALLASSSLLVNSVLPTSRSVAAGTTATIFNTVINAGTNPASGVTLSMNPAPAGTFVYQQTDCATNAVIGSPNPSLDLAPGGVLCYVLSFTPSATFAATNVHIRARASNTPSTALLTGINTWLLRSTSTPEPDIIALTTTTDFHQVACSGANAFAVALSNVGAAATGDITAVANTGAATLPVSISISETDPGTGAIIGDHVLQSVGAGENRTVAVFVAFNGCISFDSAVNRIFIEFRDASNNVVGSTSTAVSTNR